jgi:hypothetical protein
MLRAAYEETGLAAGEDWWTVPFEKCARIGDGFAGSSRSPDDF